MNSKISNPLASAIDLRDHGVAVYNGYCRSLKPWRDPVTGRDYIYAGIFTTPALVVQLDVATGRCRQFALPAPCCWPWGLEFTMEGHVLVTSCDGSLCRIDPSTGKVWVTAQTGHWLWDITRCADGKFYLATSQETRLFRYDAGTEKVEDLGRMDQKLKALRTVVDGGDG
ncbi:MAG: WD40 repeat domain-containing protein, partial [Verrucomicrobiota bacterium]